MRYSFFSVLAALFCFTLHVHAQGSLLATLSHDGTISTFYGSSALRQAHAAAASGDIITLSSGNFIPVDITKNITLRGAGTCVDVSQGLEPTVISGDFSIDVPKDSTNRLTIEGIYCNFDISYKNCSNAMFLKSRFKQITCYNNSANVLSNCSFIHCRISEYFYLGSNCSASLINCAVEDPSASENTGLFEFVNCVITYNDLYTDYVTYSSYKNCIISAMSNYNSSCNQIPSNCVAYNCVAARSVSSNPLFANMTNSTNSYSSYDSLFTTYAGAGMGQLDSETFELKEEAQTKFLGTDGTQVGIYGGSLPFDETPSNPQITKCNVAAKSTADGKLSVDIEVKAAE